MLIRAIELSDFPEVLRLNAASVEMLSPLTEASLHNLIDMSSLAIVIEDGVANAIAGFVVSFAPNVDYESANYQWFSQHYSHFIYIDRIVIGASYRGQGLGKLFYDYLMQYAVEQKAEYLLAEINLEPYNQASLNFHQRLGFKQVHTLRHGAEKLVSLQEYQLSC